MENQVFYHYCDIPTFYKIISGSSIWLSDISKSNDKAEVKWFRDKFSEYILRKESEILDKYLSELESATLQEHGRDRFCDDYVHLDTAALKKSVKMYEYYNPYKPFVFSLSQARDSLSQWRGYGNNGAGLAIGFRGEYLNLINEKYNEALLSFKSVNYEESLTELLDKNSGLNPLPKDLSHIQEIISASITKASKFEPFYKNPSFREEKEWRVVLNCFNYDSPDKRFDFSLLNLSPDNGDKYFKIGPIDFHISRDLIVPHIELKITDLQKAIGEVIIGPKCSVSCEDLKFLFLELAVKKNQNTWPIAISKSTSSYR